MRASVVVNLQSTCRSSAFVAAVQAVSSVFRAVRFSMRGAEALLGQAGQFDLKRC